MSGNQFAALEIEKDTGSSSSAPTQTCEILEMDGVVRAISGFGFTCAPVSAHCGT